MVRTRSCDYCGTDIEPGTGTMFVHVDGRVVHYCSSKCENNADLGRAARDLEWTAEGQRMAGSEAGTADEVEQVAAEPPEEEADTVADEVDTVPDESEAEAVAAAAGDAGSRSGEPAGDTDDRVDDTAEADTEELDEIEGRPAGGREDEDKTSSAADADEAEANVDDEETVRDTDEDTDE
ncbi:50S ribosomal protein L24e [Halococcus saccharolyticus]|uniref:Large ribosomal subunit protein eL24 n=1 Tax=Halococcus saccharolyticus DSM 5350 TaxID=1227455 RepID=M0MSZ8_9EURY|nr:50S ribosomal protein L24e [Halococcus saccharolyticus]EMA47570.1 50S ribosomal protein L24e/unknown domain fusion protein [Halococcus saccharolyticus DSM 5350]